MVLLYWVMAITVHKKVPKKSYDEKYTAFIIYNRCSKITYDKPLNI